jgi:hypothetical protein
VCDGRVDDDLGDGQKQQTRMTKKMALNKACADNWNVEKVRERVGEWRRIDQERSGKTK